MGNTGNAKSTSPHLHFGIYTFGGAIDPLPFVNREIRTPAKITAPLKSIYSWVRNNKAVKVYTAPAIDAATLVSIEPNMIMKVESATADWYKVSLPGGETGFIASGNVVQATTPIRKVTLKRPNALLDAPIADAARKTTVGAGQQLNVLGAYKNFFYVSNQNKTEGWIAKDVL
jgi:SH3-like domain-containing protein